MNPEVAFLSALGGTVLLLLGVIYTGLRALRRIHLSLVALAVLSLALSIVFALELGEHYDLESAGWITPVHLKLARVATLAYALPLATGFATLRNPRWRRLHGRLALLVVALTLAAAATGAVMLLRAERL